jgi:hypothetical protein
MYGPMSELKNKCLIKSLGPFLYEKRSKTTRKQVFYFFFSLFMVIWAPPNGPKNLLKDRKWAGCMAQCLS